MSYRLRASRPKPATLAIHRLAINAICGHSARVIPVMNILIPGQNLGMRKNAVYVFSSFHRS